ncbi:DUF4274 domain-containing protein [Pseudoalteromonas tunicata]|jgi:hypothetical protein|uniref:DUF4274 domain-containing protein n=1 Tax=Pseudoalteromonas tunicata D2 TaxID=87626 RepID=A4CAV6_9GAMM|nr:DUF4274 domain-containing protein [Pseudoalteromonas tunicata]ATC95059.1 hypothetical protein PTUN_a2599 [Pseudoalteromonas tunicata]AXT30706.1 DUF4274 domain-containing protein [Pseudoalteromonas tunicata]EAR28514.1 hypothetical protein PTD2_21902 [Pseudoalteromonas tunicata D2]
MISEIEKKQIDQIQYEEDIDKIVSIAKASSNPCFLQQCAISYNWNEGMKLPTAIAINEYCDLGTALTLFWLAGGMSYFLKEVERNEYNNEWADFCELIVQNLTNNVYACGQVSFKPDINKLTQYKYKKAGIPSVLYQEVNGAST